MVPRREDTILVGPHASADEQSVRATQGLKSSSINPQPTHALYLVNDARHDGGDLSMQRFQR